MLLQRLVPAAPAPDADADADCCKSSMQAAGRSCARICLRWSVPPASLAPHAPMSRHQPPCHRSLTTGGAAPHGGSGSRGAAPPCRQRRGSCGLRGDGGSRAAGPGGRGHPPTQRRPRRRLMRLYTWSGASGRHGNPQHQGVKRQVACVLTGSSKAHTLIPFQPCSVCIRRRSSLYSKFSLAHLPVARNGDHSAL